MNGSCAGGVSCGADLTCKDDICKSNDGKACKKDKDCLNYPDSVVCLNDTCTAGAGLGEACSNDKPCKHSD